MLEQWFSTGCHLRYSGVTQANAFFDVSLKYYYQNIIKLQSKLLCIRHWMLQIIFSFCRVLQA